MFFFGTISTILIDLHHFVVGHPFGDGIINIGVISDEVG